MGGLGPPCDHMTLRFNEDFQTWGLFGRIIVWDETVLTCRRRYNRGRATRSTWWADGGVEVGHDGHIKRAHLFFLQEAEGRSQADILPFIIHHLSFTWRLRVRAYVLMSSMYTHPSGIWVTR